MSDFDTAKRRLEAWLLDLPGSSFHHHHADIRLLLNEVERLEKALRKVMVGLALLRPSIEDGSTHYSLTCVVREALHEVADSARKECKCNHPTSD